MFWNKKRKVNPFEGFRKKGEKLTYLGIEMMVTATSKTVFTGIGYVTTPTLVCDYKTADGKIVTISFSVEELETLKNENP